MLTHIIGAMSDSESEVLLAVKVWAAAAWADGVIADEEAQGMKAFLSVAKLSSKEVQTALGWLDEKVELDDVDIAAIPADNRQNIYAAALGVVAIDNEVSDSEKQFLERLRAALEIAEDTAAAMHKEAGIS